MLEKYPELLTTQEVAKILRVNRITVLRMVKRGDLKVAVKLKPFLFEKKMLIDFIKNGGV